MEEAILKLICDYSSVGKIVDRNFVYKLVSIVVNNNGLNAYVRDLRFDDKKTGESNDKLRVASYNLVDRNLCVNTKNIMEYIDLYSSRFLSMFDYTEQLFYDNVLITQVLLHELEHAKQNKKYNSSDTDTETVLIKMCFNRVHYLSDNNFINSLIKEGYSMDDICRLLKHQKILYVENYVYNPTERLAEINSHNIMAQVVGVGKKLPTLCDYEYYRYLRALLSGYELEGASCPAIKFINNMKHQHYWQAFSFYDFEPEKMKDKLFKQHSLIERLKLGLLVEESEYSSVNKVLIKYDKFH